MRTADQIGKKLKISGRYVRKLAERGKIPVVYVGPRAIGEGRENRSRK